MVLNKWALNVIEYGLRCFFNQQPLFGGVSELNMYIFMDMSRLTLEIRAFDLLFDLHS